MESSIRDIFFFWNCAGAWKTMISSKNDNICLYTKTCKNDNTLFKKWWLGAIYQILMVAHVTLSYSFLVVGFSYHVSFSFHPHLRSTAMPSRPLHAGRSHGPRCLGSWHYNKFPGWSQQGWQRWYLSDEISSDWVEGWEVGGGSTEFGTFGSASSCFFWRCQDQFKPEKIPLLSGFEDVWQILGVKSIPCTVLKTCEGFIRIPHSQKYIHIPSCDPSWLYQNKGEVRSYIVPTGKCMSTTCKDSIHRHLHGTMGGKQMKAGPKPV